jgi:tRNA(fMet)-specific endonuclease VapC
LTCLLDTNTCIQYLNRRSTQIERQLLARKPSDVNVCSIVKAELYNGAIRSRNPQRTLALVNRFLDQFRSLPFDDRAAEVYGRIRSRLEEQGALIGPLDLLIAAIAIANGCTLVTHNAREFSRVEGLAWEDWEGSP